MEIGVRELKRRLSEMLDRAAAGEVIRVTDRGRPKAMLSAVPGLTSLQAGIDAGWLRAPEHEEPPRAVRRAEGRASIRETLAEDRGER